MEFILTYEGKLNPKRITLTSLAPDGNPKTYPVKTHTVTTVNALSWTSILFSDPTEQEAV